MQSAVMTQNRPVRELPLHLSCSLEAQMYSDERKLPLSELLTPGPCSVSIYTQTAFWSLFPLHSVNSVSLFPVFLMNRPPLTISRILTA